MAKLKISVLLRHAKTSQLFEFLQVTMNGKLVASGGTLNVKTIEFPLGMWILNLMMNGAAMGPARPRICEKPRSCIETSTANTSTMIKYHIPKEAEIANFPMKEIYRPN